MDIQVSALGAIIGLLISIVLIFMKVPPVYGLFVGALAGGMIGGASLEETIELMISGAQDMITAILRILAAGILAGVLIKTGGAESIARTIIHKIGETRALFALALATLILTAVGVFVDIAVVTVAPIALVIAKNANISKTAILLAMVGGGKAGNIMSPNPNTIALSDAFATPLTSVMLAGVLPGIVALFLLIFSETFKFNEKDAKVALTDIEHKESPETKLPSFKAALSAPLVAVVLLSLRPTFGIEIDPMVALPLGGIAGSILMGQFQGIIDQATFGLSKMSNVAVLLIGTGLIAGVITNSTLGDVLIRFISDLGLPVYLLAPLAGTMMSAATASTTSGAIVAGQVFNTTLLESGISGIAGAAMIHAGATVLDHMPHGSFYHATGGSVQMSFKARLKVVPYETLVGLVITAVSVIMFGVVS
ncbi:putative D-glycerate transporter [Tetragenococcus muriaticus PMC-11-5]|uniref:Putative D-glycerate transporter n=1 Tax=Tetragenococcus muriaticus PMC-11-5 TaxID=1302649 RepID=A0A091CDC4_9ENTE|nr:SLC13 family permease [Tetragenococcus muriaticus]KFN91838.1 putative D-glycerate transporter [Tetragenococcus muriaticus PMC-11-5]